MKIAIKNGKLLILNIYNKRSTNNILVFEYLFINEKINTF